MGVGVKVGVIVLVASDSSNAGSTTTGPTTTAGVGGSKSGATAEAVECVYDVVYDIDGEREGRVPGEHVRAFDGGLGGNGVALLAEVFLMVRHAQVRETVATMQGSVSHGFHVSCARILMCVA